MAERVMLSVVLPAYQEAENLRVLLPQLKEVLGGLGVGSEIVVVDTCEPCDDTEAVCRDAGARLVRRTPTDCYGDAVRTGIATAIGRFLIFMDADGSHAPSFIPELFARAEANDVVIASRYVDGGHSDNSVSSRMMSIVLNRFFAITLGLPVRDVSNSFRLYRAEPLKAITTTCKHFDILEELLFREYTQHPHLRILELPVHFLSRKHGETKRQLFRFVAGYLMTLVRLRLGR